MRLLRSRCRQRRTPSFPQRKSTRSAQTVRASTEFWRLSGLEAPSPKASFNENRTTANPLQCRPESTCSTTMTRSISDFSVSTPHRTVSWAEFSAEIMMLARTMSTFTSTPTMTAATATGSRLRLPAFKPRAQCSTRQTLPPLGMLSGSPPLEEPIARGWPKYECRSRPSDMPDRERMDGD